MAHLWKWLGLAAALYGLIAAWAVAAPQRPRAQQQQMIKAFDDLEGMDSLEGIEQLFHRAPPEDGLVASRIDFETESLPPHTEPPTDTAIIETANGGHLLRWEFVAGEIAPHGLLQPLRGAPGLTTLRLRVRADRETKLAIGVREADGSMYLSPHVVGPQAQLIEIPLNKLTRHRQVEDDNGHLDSEQISALLVIHRAKSQRPRQQGPVGFELDDIELH